MEQERIRARERNNRCWAGLRDAPGQQKLGWALRLFADGLAEDERGVLDGERGRLSERLARARQQRGGEGACYSRAQEQAARVVTTLQRSGLPRVADAFLDRARAMAPALLGCYPRWVSRHRALDAMLDGWSPAGRLAGLAMPDRAGLVDLVQLLSGALYLGLDRGLEQELAAVWPAMGEARQAEPRLHDVAAALVRDVTLAEHMRQEHASARALQPRLPSLVDHLTGRVRGVYRRERFAAGRPEPELALDLERVTMELAGELFRRRGWPAGRALLARRVLAHCLVPRQDVHVSGGSGPIWAGLDDGAPALRVLPPARAVLGAVRVGARMDLTGQYQGAALALVLPDWLDLLAERGLLGTRETDEAAVYLGGLLASAAVQRHVWCHYYDPTVVRRLRRCWFRPQPLPLAVGR